MKEPRLLTLLLSVIAVALDGSAAPATGWVSIYDPQQNSVRFVGSTATTDSPVTTEADQDAIAANFPSVTLADGDALTVTGRVTLDSALANGQFRVGLFTGPTVTQDVDRPYLGIYSMAPTSNAQALQLSRTTTNLFGNGIALVNGFLPANASGVAANTPIHFLLTLARNGTKLDVTSSYTDNGTYFSSNAVQGLNVLAAAPSFNYTFNTVAFLFGGSQNGQQGAFSNIDVTLRHRNPDTNSPAPLGARVLGIDFNCDSAPGSPSQSGFRIISGSTVQASNAPSCTKMIGGSGVTITQPGGINFEFRGANDDSTRAIPGGDVSCAYLVSDFIATREGAIDITITNLPPGNYFFRSWHLDTFTGNTLGFAQGVATNSPNLIEARLDGVVQASVQPTALGSAGLNTTFIDDPQIPNLAFNFTNNATLPLVIQLRSRLTNAANDSFLPLNGFEIRQGVTP